MEEAILPQGLLPSSGRSVSSLLYLPCPFLSVLCNNLQGKGLLVTSGHLSLVSQVTGRRRNDTVEKIPEPPPQDNSVYTGEPSMPGGGCPEPTLWPEDSTRFLLETEGREEDEQGVLGEAQSLPFILYPLSP